MNQALIRCLEFSDEESARFRRPDAAALRFENLNGAFKQRASLAEVLLSQGQSTEIGDVSYQLPGIRRRLLENLQGSIVELLAREG